MCLHTGSLWCLFVHIFLGKHLGPVYTATFQCDYVYVEQILLPFSVCLHGNVSVFTWTSKVLLSSNQDGNKQLSSDDGPPDFSPFSAIDERGSDIEEEGAYNEGRNGRIEGP